MVFEEEYRINITEKYLYKFNNDTSIVIETITPNVLSILGKHNLFFKLIKLFLQCLK